MEATVVPQRQAVTDDSIATASAREVASPHAAGPDFLRAVAILLVMLWHLPKPARLESLQSLREYSWTGVDLFFVLSGYLIGTQLLTPLAQGRGPMRWRDFYLKRSFRILPAFLVVLAVYVFVPPLREVPNLMPVWRFLTFTMNFGLDFRVGGSFSQAWSLCVEEHFYLVLPALVLLLSRVRWRGGVLLLVGSILIGGMLLRAALWIPIAAEAASQGAQHQFGAAYLKAIYYPTYCRLDGLLFGVLLAAYRCFYPTQWQRYAEPRLMLAAGVAAIGLAGVLCYFPATGFIGGPSLSFAGAVFGYPLFSLGCACLLSASLNWEKWFPKWRVPGAAAIATLAYSLYLTHKMTSHANQALFAPETLTGVSGFAIYYGMSIAVASVLWLLVERPFLRLRDRVLLPRRRPGSLPAQG